jgi:hypothetical protein
MGNGKLPKETLAVAQSGGVDFETVRTRRREVFFDGCEKLFFDWQPGILWHD